MFEFKLPDLGEGITEGELLKWYVKEGDTIGQDEDMMDVETDKAAVTISAPVGGTVAKLNGNVGDILNVGDVVVVIDDGTGGAVAAAAPAAQAAPAAAAQPAAASLPTAPDPSVVAANGSDSHASERPLGRPVPAAPATRRLAREMKIDINTVRGTGPGGRVTPEDVRAFAAGGAVSTAAATTTEAATAGDSGSTEMPAFTAGEVSGIPFLEVEPLPDFEKIGPVEREPLRSIRRKVAKKMATSMILVPHVAHMDEADVTELEAFRKAMRKKHAEGPASRLTLIPFVMRALVSLLRKYPQFNASLDPFRNEIIYKKFYHVGFAADTPRGLMVPVVKDVDRKSILHVGGEITDLANQAREGSIDAGELRNSTITITNVGPIGGTGLIPTINYPEVAILGMGRTQEKPVVRNGEIVIRKILPLTLAFDHRVADGAQAAYMMTELVKLLSDPNQLLLEV